MSFAVQILELDDNARLEDEGGVMLLEDEEIMIEDEETMVMIEDDDEIPLLEDKNPSIEELLLLLLSESELLDGQFSAELDLEGLEGFVAEFEDRFSSGKCKVQEINA